MGANFKFDEMLPTIQTGSSSAMDPRRQVEVFTHGSGLFLRIGQVDEQDTGINTYTVELSMANAKKLIASIQAGVEFLNLPEY